MGKDLEGIRHFPVVLERFDAKVTIVITDDDTIYFPVAHLCEAFGINSKRQIENIGDDPYYTIEHPGSFDELPVPTAGGMQAMKCLRRKECARWISVIDARRAKEAVRGRLQEFQQELWNIADRLLFGDLSNVVARSLSSQFVRGELRLGTCPRCRTPLTLIMDENGGRLEILDDER